MQRTDLSLIKMITDHYYIKRDLTVKKIEHKGRYYFDKFERVDEPLSLLVQKEHAERKIIVAHSLINKLNKVENIVFDFQKNEIDRPYPWKHGNMPPHISLSLA